MNEPLSDLPATDWEAVMAAALAESGGPLTADEREWAASTLGLSFDPVDSPQSSVGTSVTESDAQPARPVDVYGELLA